MREDRKYDPYYKSPKDGENMYVNYDEMKFYAELSDIEIIKEGKLYMKLPLHPTQRSIYNLYEKDEDDNFNLSRNIDISKEYFTKTTDLYVIRIKDKHFVKIGLSTNVKHRLINLNVASPFELYVALVVKNVHRGLEEFIHSKLVRSKVRGEWFKFEKEVKEFVAKPEDLIRQYYKMLYRQFFIKHKRKK